MTLIYALLILPFIVWSGLYEGPKVFVFLLIGLYIAVSFLIDGLNKKPVITLKVSDKLFLLWILILLISGVFNVTFLTSLSGGMYRNQGVLFFAALFLVRLRIRQITAKEKLFLHKALAVSVLLQCFIVFYQGITGSIYFGKPLGTLGEANALAGYLAMYSYFVFKYLPDYLYALPIIGILMTESRSGLIALIPNLTMLIKSLVKNKWLNIAVNVAGIIIVFVSIYFLSGMKLQSTVEERGVIWQHSVTAIKNSPLIGYGAESTAKVLEASFMKTGISLDGIMIDRSHNILLDAAMWTGIPGAFIFLLFIYFIFKEEKNWPKKAALISFVVYSLFQPLSVVHFLLLSLL